MNASEVLKGFAMKQVYSYLDKDPEANLPNLLDMLEKYDKNGQAVTTQVEGIRAVDDNGLHQFFCAVRRQCPSTGSSPASTSCCSGLKARHGSLQPAW